MATFNHHEWMIYHSVPNQRKRERFRFRSFDHYTDDQIIAKFNEVDIKRIDYKGKVSRTL